MKTKFLTFLSLWLTVAFAADNPTPTWSKKTLWMEGDGLNAAGVSSAATEEEAKEMASESALQKLQAFFSSVGADGSHAEIETQTFISVKEKDGSFTGYRLLRLHIPKKESEERELASSVDGSDLTAAVTSGDLTRLRELFAHGANANEVLNEWGQTALFLAAFNGNLELCRFLIDRGANVNAHDNHNATPLFYSVERGNLDITKLLVEKNASLEETNRSGNTVLHVAAANSPPITGFLLSHGANPNEKNLAKETPAFWAACNGQLESLKLLIGKGADPNLFSGTGQSPKDCAQKKGFGDVVAFLRAQELSNDGQELLTAFQTNHFDTTVLKRYLKKGGNPELTSDQGESLLSLAVRSGKEPLDIMRLLIERGARTDQVNSGDQSPLELALLFDHTRTVKFFLDKGADPNRINRVGETAFISAIQEGKNAIAEMMLNKGANPEGHAYALTTPLIEASRRGELDLVNHLLKKGVGANVMKNGTSALHAAIYNGHTKVVEALIRHGADVNQPDSQEKTPLFIAQRDDRNDIAKLLKKKGAVGMYPSAAFNSASQTCREGVTDGCLQLASYYADGSEAKQSFLMAAEIYGTSCYQGSAEACDLAADSLTHEADKYFAGNSKNKELARKASSFYSLAAKAFDKRCTEGQAATCAHEGDYYLAGRGVKEDAKKAAAFFEKACYGNSAEGCNSLAELNISGRGVPKSVENAAVLLSKACDNGNQSSCTTLATFYRDGTAVEKSAPKAIALYEKACDKNIPAACHQLALIYDDGKGIIRSPAQAAEYYSRACEQDYGESCSRLSQIKN